MTTPPPARVYSRREVLRLGGLSLFMPSWAAGKESAAGGAFDFIVLNDTHFLDETCAQWFTQVVDGIKKSAPTAVACLIAGDVTDRGTAKACAAMRDLFGQLDMPVHAVPGNHDYLTDTDRSGYDAVFPGQLNYGFEHQGWQFIALDSTQGTQFIDTVISAATLAWLDAEIPKLDAGKPTFVFTHFPLGEGLEMRPTNSAELIGKLQKLNLRWVHSGHWHGASLHSVGKAELMTSRCCARIRDNHDGSPLKGWHVYRAAGDGTLTRRFETVPGLKI